jgi:WD40 repeat protein
MINEIKLPQEDRSSCLEIYQSNGTLLCGTHRGSIYVIKTPLSNTGIFHYLAHSARVTQIVVAFHESLIISACEDGILMLWDTQIKRSVNSEDWTPVVLHNKARFLNLVNIRTIHLLVMKSFVLRLI